MLVSPPMVLSGLRLANEALWHTLPGALPFTSSFLKKLDLWGVCLQFSYHTRYKRVTRGAWIWWTSTCLAEFSSHCCLYDRLFLLPFPEEGNLIQCATFFTSECCGRVRSCSMLATNVIVSFCSQGPISASGLDRWRGGLEMHLDPSWQLLERVHFYHCSTKLRSCVRFLLMKWDAVSPQHFNYSNV